MKIVVIDGNFVAHKCRFTDSVLYQGKETGVFHSLLETTLDLGTVFETQNVNFVFDSKHSYRKRKYSWYKQRRAQNREKLSEQERFLLSSMYRQIDQSKKFLEKCGFNVFLQNGVEGDDLIASLVFFNKNHKIIIASSDQDLYQLLRKNVEIVTPNQRWIGRSMTSELFEKKFGILPSQWSEFKAINGCHSDEVPNIGKKDGKVIFKVGEKTTLKYLKGEMNENDKFVKNISMDFAQENLKRNRWLVKIPFEKTKPIQVQKSKINFENLTSVFEEYCFNDFLQDRIDEWRRFCENTQNRPED